MIYLKKKDGKYVLTIGYETNEFETLTDALYHLKEVRKNG
jgi:hypothetical protein